MAYSKKPEPKAAVVAKPTPTPPPKAADQPKKKKEKADYGIDFDATTATNDWPLWTPSTYVRARKVEEDSVFGNQKVKGGSYVVITPDYDVSTVDAEKFEDEYEIVKGPHKQEF